MRHPRSALLLALPLFALPSAGQEPAPDAALERGRALFLANCATCHGELGDGKGVTELDRPARSFRDGGFSFGNTPEALLRTITNGIPGSPMPAFDHALKDDDRRLVARYVLTLGPEAPPEAPRDTELVVSDRPLVVRGMLPPIAESAPARPRGLLVGLPSGLTVEYRTDDVRLLGLRLGGFVDRSDWIGRGGTPLKPLGKVVELLDGGDPGPGYALAPPSGVGTGKDLIDLRARLAGSWVRGEEAGVAYELETPEGERVARVEESLRVVPCAVGAGFARRFRIDALGKECTLVPRCVHVRQPDTEAVDDTIVVSAKDGPDWSLRGGLASLLVEELAPGRDRVSLLSRPDCLGGWALRYGWILSVRCTPSEPSRFEEAWFYTTGWDAKTRDAFLAEVLQ